MNEIASISAVLAHQKPEEVVTGLWRAWAKQDKKTTLSLCSEDMIFSLYVPEHILPFGGETTGKPSVSDRLQTVISQFETIAYEGTVRHTEGDTVHGVVHYAFRHRATGETIEGDMRQVIVVRDGLIVDLKEYHDLKRVTDYMRLVSEAAVKR